MAQLTAQDVVEKRFQSVKFREGYDQIEVDEFLDEVVATIHALTVENSELKAQLADCNARVAALADGAPVEEAQVVVEEKVEPEPEPEPEPAPEPVAAAAPTEEGDPQAATSMLALAQKLHDEYVADGREEGERLVSEAKQEGLTIVKDAEDERSKVLSKLKREQSDLEESINNLRVFESDYRTSISEHLQRLLSEVKSKPKES